jgi:hypothetical protein
VWKLWRDFVCKYEAIQKNWAMYCKCILVLYSFVFLCCTLLWKTWRHKWNVYWWLCHNEMTVNKLFLPRLGIESPFRREISTFAQRIFCLRVGRGGKYNFLHAVQRIVDRWRLPSCRFVAVLLWLQAIHCRFSSFSPLRHTSMVFFYSLNMQSYLWGGSPVLERFLSVICAKCINWTHDGDVICLSVRLFYVRSYYTGFDYTGCPVTLCQYFRILFLRSFPVRNAIWTQPDSQRL